MSSQAITWKHSFRDSAARRGVFPWFGWFLTLKTQNAVIPLICSSIGLVLLGTFSRLIVNVSWWIHSLLWEEILYSMGLFLPHGKVKLIYQLTQLGKSNGRKLNIIYAVSCDGRSDNYRDDKQRRGCVRVVISENLPQIPSSYRVRYHVNTREWTNLEGLQDQSK